MLSCYFLVLLLLLLCIFFVIVVWFNRVCYVSKRTVWSRRVDWSRGPNTSFDATVIVVPFDSGSRRCPSSEEVRRRFGSGSQCRRCRDWLGFVSWSWSIVSVSWIVSTSASSSSSRIRCIIVWLTVTPINPLRFSINVFIDRVEGLRLRTINIVPVVTG